jgi:hypothetical protein
MAGVTAATLTGAGFTAGAAGAGPAGGTVYTQTVGSIVVNVTLSTQAESGGGQNGVLQVVPNGDVSAADVRSVANLLAAIGFPLIANTLNQGSAITAGNPGAENVSLIGLGTGSFGGSYSQGF